MRIQMNRRSFVQMSLAAGGFALSQRFLPAQAPQAGDHLSQMLAAGASTPIKVAKLSDGIFLFQGAGGNMAVQTGPDGKLLIDSSFSTAAPRLRAALASVGNEPASMLINTHWHLDHTDGNLNMHADGFRICAHQNARARMAVPENMKLFAMSLPAAPKEALPAVTFSDSMQIFHNGDSLELAHFDPAHTDSDIYIHFQNADVLHVGDIFFNGMYPFIDEGTGGSIGGMLKATQSALDLSSSNTKIIPGHGPLGTKPQLQLFHDMLSTVRDRVAGLKAAGASEQEAIAKKPTADLDSTWNKGMFSPDMLVGICYRTIQEGRT
jgi:cyclase